MDQLPVVALDIDDTLNITLPADRDPADWLIIPDLHIPASAPPYLVGGGQIDLSMPIAVRRAVLAWINQQHGVTAQFAWATTWDRAAATVFAPAVGLPDLQVLTTVDTTVPKWTMSSVVWKARALSDLVDPERPLVWVDNDAYTYATPDPFDLDTVATIYDIPDDDTDALQDTADRDHLASLVQRNLNRRRDPHQQLVIAPDPATGITDAHIHRINTWLASQH